MLLPPLSEYLRSHCCCLVGSRRHHYWCSGWRWWGRWWWRHPTTHWSRRRRRGRGRWWHTTSHHRKRRWHTEDIFTLALLRLLAQNLSEDFDVPMTMPMPMTRWWWWRWRRTKVHRLLLRHGPHHHVDLPVRLDYMFPELREDNCWMHVSLKNNSKTEKAKYILCPSGPMRS